MKQKFFGLLEDLFIGARVKGDTGISNLLNLKSEYFQKFQKELEDKIDNLDEAVYDRLYTFFKSYFNESGSLFFSNTPKWQKRYTRVSNKDVELFYKTKDLYYIKSQKVYENLEIEIDEMKFYFDASLLGERIGNEKKEVEFLFSDIKDNKLVFLVRYKTNQKYDILKEITQENEANKAKAEILNNIEKYKDRISFEENYIYKNLDKFKNRQGNISHNTFEMVIKEIEDKDSLFKKTHIILTLTDIKNIQKLIDIDEETLNKAFKIYNKQIQIDYFIHKDARSFLKEQFDLWIYDYLANDIDSIFDEYTLKEIQEIKKIAYELIDKIADFEDELKAIYLKPRFVIDSNYVITKDRLEKYEILDKFLENDGIKEQIKEWKELKLVDENFELNSINDEKYKYLPFDTKHFKDIEIDLLEKIDNLDDEVDGRLIKSENFQALNTLLPKYRNQIDLIYIDPPYNAPSSEIVYINRFKHSTWLTMMENRISLAKEFLKKNGIFECAIDDNERDRLNNLLFKIYGEENFISSLCVIQNPGGRSDDKFIATTHEYCLLYANDKERLKLNKLKNDNFKGKINLNPFRRGGSNSTPDKRPNLHYPIYFSIKDNKILLEKENNKDMVEILPIDTNGIKRVWRWGKKRLINNLDKLIVRQVNGRYDVFVKEEENEFIKPKSLWNKSNYAGSTGTLILKNMDLKFDFPKSPFLLYDIFSLAENKKFNILDFFAGSGTTADAVIRLNKDDGGNRKFLLIEIGEHFNNVILPRIKKLCVSLNYKQGYPQDRDGNSLFFKYYKLEQFEDILQNIKII